MMILHLLFLVALVPSGVFTINEEKVTCKLYGTVVLPCVLSFVKDSTDLTVIWEKKENSKRLLLYKMEKEKEKPEERDSIYKGRVKISKAFKQGNLGLTLTNVLYEDEGNYYCRAANNKGHGEKKVTLFIDDLNAGLPTATLVTIGGKQRWKCMGSGVYRVPQVQWITAEEEDLSSYGNQTITERRNGWKLVESVLDYDVEPNVQVLCHIKEGRLKRSARAVMSDGEHSISVKGEL